MHTCTWIYVGHRYGHAPTHTYIKHGMKYISHEQQGIKRKQGVDANGYLPVTTPASAAVWRHLSAFLGVQAVETRDPTDPG